MGHINHLIAYSSVLKWQLCMCRYQSFGFLVWSMNSAYAQFLTQPLPSFVFRCYKIADISTTPTDTSTSQTLT